MQYFKLCLDYRMRRLKKLGCSSDPVSLGCIYLCVVSAAHGYLLGADYLNDLQDTETLDDGGIPHKRTTRAEGEGGSEANVDGGVVDGDLGDSSGGGRGFVSFSEAPPKFVEARQFGKVLLECAATGTPAPQIKWYKDGKPLHKVETHIQY